MRKAAEKIKSRELSANNNAISWNSLCESYNNGRILVHNPVKSLFTLEAVIKVYKEKKK